MNSSMYSRKPSAKLPRNSRAGTRKSVSPVRLDGWRPTTWIANATDSLAKTQAFRASQMNLIKEANGNELKAQDKDIEIERLQTTCYSLNNKAAITDDQAIEIQTLRRRLQESEQVREQQLKTIGNLEAERQLNVKTRNLQEETINGYENNREQYERRRRQLESELAMQEKARIQQDNEINTLQNHNAVLRQDLEESYDQRDNMQKELDTATEYIISMEEKVYKSNKISLELLAQLKECELQLGQVPYYLLDYKTRFAYNPAGNDLIDTRLSEFINLHPNRPQLKLLFHRVSEGVYKFGQKKVTMKVENNYLKVRVGGGYLTIDEFVDQYLPLEMQKVTGYATDAEKLGQIAVLENQLGKELARRESALGNSGKVSPSKRYGGAAKSFDLSM